MANRSNIMGLQFQFHKGTIRTYFCTRIQSLMFYFNSIKVQLELLKLLLRCLFMHYFNSIKVQLEHMVSFAQVALCLLFQFHKGTIRTP